MQSSSNVENYLNRFIEQSAYNGCYSGVFICLKIKVGISLRGHDFNGALLMRFSTSLGKVGLMNIEFRIELFKKCIGDKVATGILN